jgi:hypothetical protein
MKTRNGGRRPTDWLTLLANIGVVMGLILLAYEIREANKLSTTQAYIDRLDQMQQTSADFSQSEFLPEIYSKVSVIDWTSTDAIDDIELLTDIERSRLLSWERGVMLRMSGHYYQYIQGYIEEQTGEQVLNGARAKLPLWNALGIEIEGQDFRVAVEGGSEN